MEANPDYDVQSEKRQEYQDKVDRIFDRLYQSKDASTIKEAVVWGWSQGKLEEISETISGDDMYLGSLVSGLVTEFLWKEAEDEANEENN